MTILPAGAFVERVGWTLLHFLWQGVLIAKVFAAARGLAGRAMSPRARYGLACFALAAMTISLPVTFVLIGGGNPAIPTNASAWSVRPFTGSVSRLAPEQLIASLPGLSQRIFPWLVTAWLCGVLAFSIRLAGGWAVGSRIRSGPSSRPAPSEWQKKLDELVLHVRFSRPVRLLVSSLAHAPMAAGYLRPAILMPVGALTGLPPEQIEALLAHELAHILRNDYLMNLLQGAAEALLFYHPCVWWISKEIRAERELCCDEFAVRLSGDVLTYARALAAVESHRVSRLRLAVAADGGSLRDRIQRPLDPCRAAPTQSSRGAAAALSILLLAGIGAAAMNRNAQPTPAVRLRLGRRIEVSSLAPAHQTAQARTATRHNRLSHDRESATVIPAGKSEGLPVDLPHSLLEKPMQVRFGNGELRVWAPVEGEPVLDGIEMRGMTQEFANELRARLPIQEGQRVSHLARERIGSMTREYGRQMEFSLVGDAEGGAVLRIHPPGSANEPLVPRDSDTERKKK